MDFKELAARVEVANIERYARIPHPEAALIGTIKEKQHAMVFIEAFAMHKPFLLLCRFERDL
jgi:hypothetical protein